MRLSNPPTRVQDGKADGDSAASADRAEAAAGQAALAGKHRPAVERIACWSARHRLVAIAAWLAMVGGALLAGHVFGTQSQPHYDPGASGVAERMLGQLHVISPP